MYRPVSSGAWALERLCFNRTVLKEEGLKGLYKGCGITCARAVPSHALIFYFYEVADRFLMRF